MIDIQVGKPSVVEIEKEGLKLSLVARKTMDGNIMVEDHDLIEVIIKINDKAIVSYPKEHMNDAVYSAQDRLFEFLAEKGVIDQETIKGGNVYNSIQGEYQDAAGGENTTEVVLFNIGKWIQEEKPYLKNREHLIQQGIERLTDPDEENSTELGEIPQKRKQGGLSPNDIKTYLGSNY